VGVRFAREHGLNTSLWECGLAQVPLVVDEILDDVQLAGAIQFVLDPFVGRGYDKIQIIGGGQDFASAASMARSLRARGFMAEALYTDSAWHGPLATVGGLDADHDTLIFILATDPLFQPAALVDTQVYRTRNASVVLVVPEGNQNLPVVRGVGASAVLAVPPAPRPFLPMINAALGTLLAQNMAYLWGD
jgi:glucosamine 6-phosphate synthetase-like amidotransferase/phosphosugar isomerase protein